MQYLFKHREKYYYKRRFPQTTKNLVVSLQTESKSEAQFISAIITVQINILFKDKKLISNEELILIKSTIKEYVQSAKEEYGYYAEQREKNYQYTTKKASVRLGSHPKAIEKAIDNLINMLYSPNKIEAYKKIVAASKMQNKFTQVYNSLSPYGQDRFIDELIKSEVEVLHYDKRRNEDRVKTPMKSPTYLDIALAEEIRRYNEPYIPVQKDPVKDKYYSKTAQELRNDYVSKISVKDPRRIERDIDILLDIVDKEYLIDYTHEDMDMFHKCISFMPNKNEHKELFEKHTFKKVIEIAIKQGLTPIAKSTLYTKVAHINNFLDDAVDREFLDKNRLRNKGDLSSKSSEDKRKEYYISQLNKLFNDSPQYTTHFKTNLEKFPSRIWIPLMLLFEGCRLNEAAQLYLNQIIEIDGYHFLKIKEEADDQQTKNATSNRTIPIHPTLIDLGILKFIEKQRNKGHERLFPELYHTKGKGYGQAYSKIYNEDKKEWLEETTLQKIANKEILLDLHSFRHNFSGSLKGLIEDGILDYLSGHKSTSQSQRRYGKFRPELKYEMLSKCQYPNLDLSLLKEKLLKYYVD